MRRREKDAQRRAAAERLAAEAEAAENARELLRQEEAAAEARRRAAERTEARAAARAAKAAGGSSSADVEESEEEAVALCVCVDKDGKLYGAIGWFDLGSLPTSLEGTQQTSEPLPPPRRMHAIDDPSWEPSSLMHMGLQGYGEGAKPIVPVGKGMYGNSAFHMAVGMAEFHIAKAQIECRLRQNRASDAERAHVEMLLDATRERFASIALESAAEKWLTMEFTRAESATQGLRKTLVRRPWNARCAACGVRHEGIEFSTCKFWQAWVV